MKLKKRVIYKNWHYSLLPQYSLHRVKDKKTFSWALQIHPTFAAKLPPNDPDQYDWSKLAGISATPILNAKKNAFLWAWRYNPDSGAAPCVELSPYIHLPDGEVLTWRTGACPIQLPLGAEVHLYISVNRMLSTVSFVAQTPTEYHYLDLMLPASHIKWVRQVSTWYGGNQKSPRKIIIPKSKIRITPQFITNPHGKYIKWGAETKPMRLVLSQEMQDEKDDLESGEKSESNG